MANWYQSLKRSSLTPPDWVFSIVWPILYVMILISFVLYYSSSGTNKTLGYTLFFIGLAFNLSWSPVFFRLQRPGLSLVIIILLLVTTYLMIIEFNKINLLSARLLIPYFAWLSFASYLNGYIWYYNN